MSAIRKFDNAGPFRSTKFGPRRYYKGTVFGKKVTFTYPNKPPTVEQQRALMATPVVACSSCSATDQAQGWCHTVWLKRFLKAKFDLHVKDCPEVISSAIPDMIVDEARASGDWARAKAVHQWAYIDKGAVQLMRKAHPRGVPKLIENMTSSASIFGNPFTGIPIHISRALYQRYMDKGFEPLTPEEVDDVAEHTCPHTGRDTREL